MSNFTDLLQDPYAKKVYLAEIQAYNLNTLAMETLYFSTLPYVTAPSDTPANKYYEPRLNTALNFQRSMYKPERIGGNSTPGFGVLRLNNTDGGLDNLEGYSLAGRPITIKLGAILFDFNDFGVVFEGTCAAVAISKDVIEISLKDLQEKLKLPIQSNLYGGTGGVDGGEDIEGKPKPLIYGEVYNIRPVLVDSGSLIYQINDGTVEEILAVYDKGARLTPPLSFTASDISFVSGTKTISTVGAVDFSTVLDGMLITVSGTTSNNGDFTVVSHTATTIVVSEAVVTEAAGSSFTITHKSGSNGYTTDLSNGRFTLVNSPSGEITADAQGDNSGSGWVYTVSDIIKRIVVDKGGLTDPGDLDVASFSSLNASTSAKVGIYIDVDIDMIGVLDQLSNSIGAFYGYNRAGLFNVGRFDVASGVEDLNLSSVDIISINALGTTQPAWRIKVGYRKNYTVQTDNDLAGVVASDAARFDFATNQYRYRSSEDTAVKTKHLLAQELIFDTLLVDEADAASEASRLLVLLKERRRMFKVQAKTQPFNININDVVKITLSRFSLGAGVDFRVISIADNSINNSATLEVWG